MATHLSEKENYLRTLRGETPEYVPTYRMGEWTCWPEAVRPPFGSGEFKDFFGVEHVTEVTAGNGSIPKPGVFLLDDIRRWRDVIKRPAFLDDLDWEKMAKKELDNRDPELLKLWGGNISLGYFQALVSFMGFANGLIACVEEPDEVKELMHFLLEINLEIGRKYIQYFKPDGFAGADDIAHERAPFVSLDVFLDIFEPVWRAEVAPFKELGLPAQHHNCGKFELFVPYIVDMGFDSWDPAQSSNDLLGIKERFKGRLTICTGVESNGFCSYPETTEEEIRAEVRRVMDLYAPGGGYCFMGGILGRPGDEEIAKRNGWIRDEYEKNKFKYYS
ncbi:MAG: veratrol--corrinoid protein metyltransferase [Oscillospiraceae bacterium]|nr:veratrol--corrinoid protein metyltransferase [Oscillospiraceae bacterium]